MNPTGTNGGNSWTSEQVQELTRLVGDGLSAGQIARDMGVHTRNSIIGKIHRLGLKLARLPTQSNVPRPRSQKPSVPGNRNGGEPIAPTPLKIHATPPECAPMLLLDAGLCNCRWDMGRRGPGEPLICGARTATFGSSWCEYHHKLVMGAGARSERGVAKIARAA